METKHDTLKAIVQDPAKRRAWVKFQLHLQGRSMAQLAVELGVTRSCVRTALDRPYPRMEKVLADALGLTPQTLFPERYDALGVPNRPIGRPRISEHKDREKKTISNARRRKAA